MNNIQIISDGSCDLSKEEVKSLNVKIVPFYVSFDGETYQKEVEEVDVREFYQKMVDNKDVFPKTSLPSVDDYIKAFTPYLEEGKDIICICITTKFSGSFNSAMNAKQMLETKYPEQKIEIIDAIVNTCLQGLVVKEACRMRDDGLTFEEIVENTNRIKHTARIFFTVGSMDYLRHGGRIGKLVGLVGATLKIKPLIVLKQGEIFSGGICFSRKKSLVKVLSLIQKHFKEINDDPKNYRFIIGYGHDVKEAMDFAPKIEQALNVGKIELGQIGATIGVHTGPYPFGLGLIKKYDC